MSQKNKKVAFIHPDLGIGGAEQLVINLALALKTKNLDVTIFTPYHDPKHCFKETIDGSLTVQVRGNQFPAKIMGKGTAICAMIRMFLATLYVLLFDRSFDIFIVDQVTTCLPLIWLFRKKSIFYCHFPDKLLCVERNNIFKKFYRLFIDFLEEILMLPANIILVNSQFTKDIFSQHFPILNKIKNKPDILYPSIDFDKFKKPNSDLIQNLPFNSDIPFFFSLNRYERKKNIGLAVLAFNELLQTRQNKEIRLIIAGGYEERVQENKEYYEELVQLATSLNIQDEIIFERNISNEMRTHYLTNAIAILYTPSNEHFGIVPVEGMYNQRPVIGMNNGGPKESIENEKTGFLLKENPKQWSEKMVQLLDDQKLCQKMGQQGKQRVLDLFSFESFTQNIFIQYSKLLKKQN